MKNSNNEPMKLMKPGMENEAARASVVPSGRTNFGTDFPGTLCLANFRCPFATLPNGDGDAGGSGKRWVGRRGFTALSGWEVGKAWNFYRLATGFSRVFPHKSTQVVDFPHLAMAGVFREVMKLDLATDGTRIKHGYRQDGLIKKAGTEEIRNEKQEGLTTDT